MRKFSLFPESIEQALFKADPAWHPILREGLRRVEEASPGYFEKLQKEAFLPSGGRLFSAFSLPPGAVRYILVGEGPYPRDESASGYAFMDAAVGALWSEKGLSKAVNRATSLRNFIKMLLAADGFLDEENTTGPAVLKAIKKSFPDGRKVETLAALQEKLLGKGFLLLNASLVFRKTVPAAKETRIWQPFLHTVLSYLAERSGSGGLKPYLILWGKMAERLTEAPYIASFNVLQSEHPYNLSFIKNKEVQAFFRPLKLLYENP